MLVQAASLILYHPLLPALGFPIRSFSCEVLLCGTGLAEPLPALTFSVTEADMNCSLVNDSRAEPTLRAPLSNTDGWGDSFIQEKEMTMSFSPEVL